MKDVLTWHWRVRNPIKPTRTYVTRYTMTEEDAQARHPGAIKVGLPIVRRVCETEADWWSLVHTSPPRNKPPDGERHDS